MKNNWKTSLKDQRRRKRRNRILLLCVAVLSLASIVWSFIPKTAVTDMAVVPNVLETEQLSVDKTQPPPPPDNIFVHNISAGDNLSVIFDTMLINQQTMLKILAADEQLLALDVLRPGNRLIFTLDKESRDLESMELFVHLGRQVIYQRIDAAHFESREIDIPGVWEQELVEGEINGSFILSAIDAGLSEQEAANITDLFESRIDFRRDLRAGDRFQVVRSLQAIGGMKTGQSKLIGIRMSGKNYDHDGFLCEDGNYYDHGGKSLARAFRRYPFSGHYRISSSFNPRRRHPITKRISPHNGTDFAMPTGTTIFSVGDGVVTRIKNHPYAGKYVEVKHGENYKTRYLHLSKFLVKRGQKVKRGQRIAMSGNTGRSTGPHLHYELHIKGRVVNPVKAKIPMAASIPKENREAFRSRVAKFTAMMETGEPTQLVHYGQPKMESL